MYDWLKQALHAEAPGTVLLTALAFLTLLALIWHLTGRVGGARDDPQAIYANRLAALIGGLCGWIIGVAFEPFAGEETHFKEIWRVVSAFLSGYVVSKLDRYLEGVLFPVGKETRDSWSRLGLFVASLLLAAVTVFLNRLYAFRA
ncbi:hypothetical protein [Variovorax sp. YR216]|uniref:hypothetical protein n=1 Tax=Variovorax sp. YR216 TaxID=1882828 RepID=UPI00089B31F5|nr:hypothetical protein [Variovorax sp. YR216]SEA76385.1 hypothetical protein SAMN05444680_103478 [Variovorax sp. YR216]